VRFRTSFKVEGSGAFPCDMLRYDCCYPHTSADAALLLDWEARRTITLEKQHEGRHSSVTVRRWESFGWRVLEETIETRRAP
jgi:hypothetical protein